MPPTAADSNFIQRGSRIIARVLFEPSAALREPDVRRKARLQSTLLLINVPFMIGGAYLAERYVPGISVVLGAAALIITTAYLLSRTAYYRVGGALAFGVLAGLPFATLTLPGGYPAERVTRTLTWLVIPVLWGSIFFSWRSLLFTTGLLIAATLALPLLVPAIPFQYVALPTGFVSAVSILTLVMHWHRSRVEQDRLAELSNSNRELAALSDSLEARIQERTFELKTAIAALQEEVDVRQKAEQATLQRNQELAALNQIGQALNQLADPAEMLEVIQTTVGWIIDIRNLYIALYDEATRLVSFPLYNIDGERRPTTTSRPFGNGLTEHIILAKAPLLITHNMAAALEQRGISQIGRSAKCYLAAPMLAGDKVIGVIAVQDYEQEYAYNNNHEKLLFTIASQAAIALENSRLFAALQQELAERQRADEALISRTAELYESEQRYRRLFASAQRQAQELTLLDQVRTVLARKLEFDDVFRAIAGAVNDIFPDTRVTLYFREGDEMVQQGNFSEHDKLPRIPIAKGIIGRVVRTGKPILLEDVNSDPEFIRASPDIVSEVCVPLIDQDKVVGVLNVESVNNTKLGEADLQLMLALSAHISLAIGRARLYTTVRESHDSVQKQAVEIAALYRALAQLLNPGDVIELATQIALTVTQEFNFANCGVLLVNETETELNRVAHAGAALEPNAPVLTLDGPGLTVAAYHSGQLIYAPDVNADPRYLSGDSATRSEMVVPLQARKRVLGVLDVQSPAPDAFDERAQRILTAYTKHAALALENLQLLARLEKAYQTLRADQEQLIIAEKMASLGRLTAGIAHEMNTPLAAVRATLAELKLLAAEYADSIGDAQITIDDHRQIAQELQQSIQIADKAAERAAGFVRSIKLQTRTSGPRAYVTFNAVPVIQESLLLLGHALRRSHCAAHFAHGDAYHVALHGSPGQLGQVITNLVTNAIDASAERGGGPIVVQLTKHETEVELQVSDSGTGISPENLPRIFDPMFTTKPFGEGTGLGLTIVHDIVAGHFGGTISVASQPGQGTTFTIRIPLPTANESDSK